MLLRTPKCTKMLTAAYVPMHAGKSQAQLPRYLVAALDQANQQIYVGADKHLAVLGSHCARCCGALLATNLPLLLMLPLLLLLCLLPLGALLLHLLAAHLGLVIGSSPRLSNRAGSSASSSAPALEHRGLDRDVDAKVLRTLGWFAWGGVCKGGGSQMDE